MDPRIPFLLVGVLVIVWVIWEIAEEHGRKRARKNDPQTLDSARIIQTLVRGDQKCRK